MPGVSMPLVRCLAREAKMFKFFHASKGRLDLLRRVCERKTTRFSTARVCVYSPAARAKNAPIAARVRRRRPWAGLGEASERARGWVHRGRQDGGPTPLTEPVPAFGGGENPVRVAAGGPAGPRADLAARGPPLHRRRARDALARGARPEPGAHVRARPRLADDADARVAERRLAGARRRGADARRP